MKRFFVSLSSLFLVCGGAVKAQTPTERVITTPFTLLTIAPDARSAALGDAGVALSPDANATYWNPAKLPYTDKDFGVSLSYTPWLRNLIDDMYLTYLSGYKKVSQREVVALSINYFDMGVIDFRTPTGQSAGTFNARDFAIGGTYSRQLAQNFSMAVSLKYLHSNLAGAGNGLPGAPRPASTAAGDISAYYKKDYTNEETGSSLTWALGGMISNLGGKVSYGGEDSYFIPTNLKIGTGISYTADGRNRFNFVLDLNKLMVPTPPVWSMQNGRPVVVRGRNPNELSALSGIFGSFADAPDGFSEELKEVMISTGVEYWYNDIFAVRIGYFNQSNMKGGQKYFTAGVGARFMDRYNIDFAYLMPQGQAQGNPLAQTLRLTLALSLNKKDRNATDALDALEN